MQHLEVSGAVRLICKSLGVKGLTAHLNTKTVLCAVKKYVMTWWVIKNVLRDFKLLLTYTNIHSHSVQGQNIEINVRRTLK